jgi:DNA-binding LacI/PurR family transcriptional regulator
VIKKNKLKKGKSPARLVDIARLAGVHPSTVSRALHRSELVRPEVARLVQKTADELEYTPNRFGRSLQSRKSNTIGLIIPDAGNPLFSEVSQSIEAACYAIGYTLILCYSERNISKESAQAKILLENGVDGILMFNASDLSRDCVAWISSRGVPVVLLERRSPGPKVDCVLSDNTCGIRLLVEHLYSLGHRRIACLLDVITVSHYAERLSSFQQAAADFGIDPDPALIRTGLFSYADGKRTALDLASAAKPPTAFLCGSDTLAIGVMNGLKQIGSDIPGDFSVTGYGDTQISLYVNPTLTTVNGSKEEIGGHAVRLLLSRVRAGGGAAQRQVETKVLPVRLIVRGSTGTLQRA